jgi:hypothetical protein
MSRPWNAAALTATDAGYDDAGGSTCQMPGSIGTPPVRPAKCQSGAICGGRCTSLSGSLKCDQLSIIPPSTDRHRKAGPRRRRIDRHTGSITQLQQQSGSV